MYSFEDAIRALEQQGCKPTPSGNGYRAYCPAHEADGRAHTPSLSITQGDRQDVVMTCHAGCDYHAIQQALGLEKPAQQNAQRRIVATYSYRDLSGSEVRQKIRYEPKDFRIRHQDASGNWVYKAGPGPAVLYGLPELRQAIAQGATVFVVEGEKDCDRLHSLGLFATTNIEGAAKPDQKTKWRREYNEQLAGAARLILIPDHDEPGRAHMANIAHQLRGKVADLRWLELPGLPEKGDVSDWLNAGHTVDELWALMEQAGAPPGGESQAETAGNPTADPERLKKTLNTVVGLLSSPPWTGCIGFNEFRQCIEKRTTTPYQRPAGAWVDSDTAETMLHLERTTGTAFGRDMVDLAVLAVAHRNTFNPAQERLLALAQHWDGQPRLSSWLVEFLNAKVSEANREYLAEIGDKWLKGVAARVLKPGCKRDDVLILRSPQGWAKSTAANAMADAIHPESFTDSVELNNLAEAKIQIRGVIIAELGELAGLAKAEVESIKAFVSTRSDHFREKFGRYAQDFPRTVSFIGSTNDQTFLKDPTGNRRWWPVTLESPIDIPRLVAALPQLIGEATRRVLNGEPWHVTAEKALEQAERVREAHFEEDVWTDPVMRIVDSMESSGEAVTIPAILDALNIARMQQSPSAKQRVAGILKVNGFEEARKWLDKKNNRALRFWKKIANARNPMVPTVPIVIASQTLDKVGNRWGTIEENPMVPNAPKKSEGTSENGQWFPNGYPESLGKQRREPLEPVEPLDSLYGKNFSEEKSTSPIAKTVLATLNGTPMLREDLERALSLAHGKAGGALIKATIDQLLLSGAIAPINGKLVKVTQEARP